jgi:hypothetical protein
MTECDRDSGIDAGLKGVAWSPESREIAQCEFPGILRRYYQHPSIRRRMLEFLGGTHLEDPSALYILGNDGRSDGIEPSLPSNLPRYLEAGLDIERSLWDRESLIADVDLEYNNFDCPQTAWLNPERAFGLQTTVLNATLSHLGQTGINPLILVSGRGYHLIWAVSRNSTAFRRLIRLGRVPPGLEAKYRNDCSLAGFRVDPDLARAFAGLGLVLEFLGHRVLATSAPTCPIPVKLTAIEVGSGTAGREIVSFDISEYGDPLHHRHIRIAFSAYLKPRQLEWALGEEGVSRLLPIFEIPLSGMSLRQAIETARNPQAVIELAGSSQVHIPDLSGPMELFLDQYERSKLADFHNHFYSEPWEPMPAPETRQVLIPGAPQCLEWLLEHPNDFLLRPAALQHAVRILMALGWRPRAIARLICASYLRECNWGDQWVRLEPFNRAIFYTRLFAGMIATGADELVDMNCVSHREKGYCMIPDCRSNLITFRNMLSKGNQSE